MKTQRSLTVIMATLVLLVLSLSATFTAMSSSRGAAPDGLRTVVLTVRIVDNQSEIVSGARIVVFQGDRRLGQRDSDARGIAQMEIVVNTDRAVELVIEVSKPGMEDRKYPLRLGTNFPTRLKLEEISLKPGASRSLAVLTVLVMDKKGEKVKLAHINVYRGFFTGNFGVVPPDYQGETGVNGTAKFDIPVRLGEKLDLTLEVSREDLHTERRPLNLGTEFPTQLPLERFVLSPRVTEVEEGLPFANIKVTVADRDGNNVEGALVRIDVGNVGKANTGGRRHEQVTGPDGSATLPVELLSADSVERFVIVASKAGYKTDSRPIEINNKWGRANGKTFEAEQIWLEKLPDAFEVRVTVRDGDTTNPVPDAEVILDGPDYATGTTNSAGVATLAVDKPGSYAVRISQDNYRSLSDGQVRVLKTKKLTVADPFHLRTKHTKDAAGDTIQITVLAKDYVDAKDKPRPLRNAAVSDGRFTRHTDSTGQVTLEGAYDRGQEVTVTAPNYETRTQRVAINKTLPFSKGTGSATFILTPVLSENSPLHLIVKVVDELGKPVSGAGVEFFSHTRRSLSPIGGTDQNGKREFHSSDADGPLPELRRGISIDVEIGNKKVVVNRALPDSMLNPSLAAQEFLVQLDRSDLRTAIDALEPKVFAWNADLRGKALDEAGAFAIRAKAAVAQAEALVAELESQQEAFGIGVGPGVSNCSKAAGPQLNIRNAETQVNVKAQEVERLTNEALTLTKICSVERDVALIRSDYKKANQLLIEIGMLNRNAAKDHETLLAVSKEAVALQQRLPEAQSKLAAIERLGEVVDQNVRNATAANRRDADTSKTLISRQITLNAELAVLTVKADAEPYLPPDLRKRIDAMEGILGSTRNVVSYGTRPQQDLPESLTSAVGTINRIKVDAARVIARLTNSACKISSLDEVVEGINSTFQGASLDIGLALDVPKLADACEARIKSKGTSTSTETTEDKIDEKITESTGPTKENKPPAVEEDPEIKIDKPSKPNTQDTSSGGFWEAAKAGKKKVENAVENAVNNKSANPTNPATTGETSENKSGTNTATTTTTNKTNKPPATVEEIPEDNSTKVAANKPAAKSANKPPVVEEIPETATTNIASNRPRANSPVVEEIPETSTNNQPATSGSRGNQPNSSGASGNSQAKEKPKKEKKPRDPNQPDIWTRLGGAAREAITGQQNPGVVNNPGANTNPGNGGGTQNFNLAGTWSVTTQSTGDEDMQQNWTRTNVWQISNLGGGGWRVRQVINGQTYDENYSTVDDGGGRFRLIGSNPDGSTYEMSGTYNQSQFSVATSGGQNRITINGTRQ